jgi:histidinol phosphatase-like enzyme
MQMEWHKSGTIIYSVCSHIFPKIIGLDMDGTIIKTKSGSKFGKNAEDWIFWHDKVKSKILEYHKQ